MNIGSSGPVVHLFPAPGITDDVVEPVETRFPAQFPSGAAGIRHQARRIAGAARFLTDFKGLVCNTVYGVNHFPYREALAVAEVEPQAVATVQKVAQGEQVRLAEVA